MTLEIDQIAAIREAGKVRRCHVFPINGEYNVAIHTYNAIGLYMALCPDQNLNTVATILTHDLPERWLGDVPAPAKWENPKLKEVYEDAERDILRALELEFDISTMDSLWVKGCDMLEFLLFCIDQERLGNRNISVPMARIKNALETFLEPEYIPEELKTFYNQIMTGGFPMLEGWYDGR